MTSCCRWQIHFLLLQNRQGKTRLSKWYSPFEHEEKKQLQTEVHRMVTRRSPKYTNFIEVHTSCNFVHGLTTASVPEVQAYLQTLCRSLLHTVRGRQ